ncbi:MAG TPA: hypothetical protein VMT11_16460 [Myxococcaceae bacterium]|nr:hypothetical protein [Myxococcaceae bacterium]
MLLHPVVLTLCLLAAEPAKSDPPKTDAAKREGTVDWQGQVIKATGSGAPDMRSLSPAQARLGAEKAAQLDAFRNLIAQAKGIHISSDKTVGEAMAKDEVKGRVEGVVKGFKVVKKRYYSDQGVEMDVEVPLSGIAQAVLEPSSAQGETVAAKATEGRYTGLLVDARGLGAQPVLAPRLLDASGKVLYTVEMMGPEARKDAVPARYFKSLEQATHAPVLGGTPLLVRAQKAQGSDLVLADAEARALEQLSSRALAEGRVVIVP